jgi:hypothetical protein
LIANAFPEAEIDRLFAAVHPASLVARERRVGRKKVVGASRRMAGQVLSAVKGEAAGTLILNRLMTRS